MQTVVKDENITLCLWANLRKSPRFVDQKIYINQRGFSSISSQHYIYYVVIHHEAQLCRTLSFFLTGSFRFKGFNFEEAGLDFKLPKQLAVRDVGVRILHTRYDHLSLLARMAHPRMHTPGHRYLSGGAIMNNALKSAASVQSRESSAEPAEGRSSQIQTQMEALNGKMPQQTLHDTQSLNECRPAVSQND